MISKEKITKFFKLVPSYVWNYRNKEMNEFYGVDKLFYAVSGGCALSTYCNGQEQKRPISDLDLILLDDISNAFARIIEKRTKGKLKLYMNVRNMNRKSNKFYLDIFNLEEKFKNAYDFMDRYLEDYVRAVNFNGMAVPMVSPELLFITKVAGTLPIREKDIQDIERLKALDLDKRKIRELLMLARPLRVDLGNYLKY